MTNRFSLWDPRKNEDYQYIDATVEEIFYIGGTPAFVYKYMGPDSQTATGNPTLPNYLANNGSISPNNIQDLALQENRNRIYDLTQYELRVVYTVQDIGFDLKQFASFLDVDTIVIELHLNACLQKLGRKLMSGDVIRLPHMRDDALLDPLAPAIDKFYVIQDVSRAAAGYSPGWWPHILRASAKPMPNSQEFAMILNQKVDPNTGDILPADTISPTAVTLGSIMSDQNAVNQVSDAILEEANAEVDKRYFETRQYWFHPDELGRDYQWVFAEDALPPDGLPNGKPLASGSNFINNPVEGDWFLRTDYTPEVLFRFENNRWMVKEHNMRKQWEASGRILTTFLNNTNQTLYQNETIIQKQALSKVLKPRADF
jgi:hypothetical protein